MAMIGADVLVSLLFGLVTTTAVIIVFSILRTRSWTRKFFCTRMYAKDVVHKPRKLKPFFTSWIVPVLRYPETDIIQTVGLDVVINLRLISFGLQLLFWVGCWCCAVVLPVHVTAWYQLDADEQTDSDVFAQASMHSVDSGGNYALFWVHLVSVYVVSSIAMALLYHYNQDVSLLRIQYLSTQRGGAGQSVLITDIPGVPHGTKPELVYRLLSKYVLWLMPVSKRPNALEWLERRFSDVTKGMQSMNHLAAGVLGVNEVVLSDVAGTDRMQTRQAMRAATTVHDSSDARVGSSGARPAAAAVTAPVAEQAVPPRATPSPYPSQDLGEITHAVSDRRHAAPRLPASNHATAVAAAAAADSAGADAPALAQGAAGLGLGQSPVPASVAQAGPGPVSESIDTERSDQDGDSRRRRSHLRFRRRVSNTDEDVQQHVPSGGRVADAKLAHLLRKREDLLSEEPALRVVFTRTRSRASDRMAGSVTNALYRMSMSVSDARGSSDVARATTVLEVLAEDDEDQAEGATPQPPDAKAAADVQCLYDFPEFHTWRYAQEELTEVSVPEFVMEHLSAVYGAGTILGVQVVCNQAALEPLVARYNLVKRTLEDTMDEYQAALKRRQRQTRKHMVKVNPKREGAWAEALWGDKVIKVHALKFYPVLLRHLKDCIDHEVERAQDNFYPSAFVTFKQRRVATIAATALVCHNESHWAAQRCPDPEEVIWQNLGLRSWQRNYFSLASLFMILLLVAVLLPIAFLCQWALDFPSKLVWSDKDPEMAQLRDRFPTLYDMYITHPDVGTIFRGLMPALVLKLAIFPLPGILHHLCKRMGVVSLSEVDFLAVRLGFLVQYLALFLGSWLGGALVVAGKLGAMQINTTDDDLTWAQVLARSAAPATFFFMAYLMTEGLVFRSLMFLRIPQFVHTWARVPLATTQRGKERLLSRNVSYYGSNVPDLIMALTLALGFCLINPFMPVLALLSFAVSNLYERYNRVYVYSPPYESNGGLWGEMVNLIMVSLYTFHAITIFYVARTGWLYILLVLPMTCVLVVFHSNIHVYFDRPWRLLSLEAAAVFDERDALEQQQALDAAVEDVLSQHPYLSKQEVANQLFEAAQEQANHDLKDRYRSPCFKVDGDDLDALLEETADLDRRIHERMELLDKAHRHSRQRLESFVSQRPAYLPSDVEAAGDAAGSGSAAADAPVERSPEDSLSRESYVSCSSYFEPNFEAYGVERPASKRVWWGWQWLGWSTAR